MQACRASRAPDPLLPAALAFHRQWPRPAAAPLVSSSCGSNEQQQQRQCHQSATCLELLSMLTAPPPPHPPAAAALAQASASAFEQTVATACASGEGLAGVCGPIATGHAVCSASCFVTCPARPHPPHAVVRCHPHSPALASCPSHTTSSFLFAAFASVCAAGGTSASDFDQEVQKVVVSLN